MEKTPSPDIYGPELPPSTQTAEVLLRNLAAFLSEAEDESEADNCEVYINDWDSHHSTGRQLKNGIGLCIKEIIEGSESDASKNSTYIFHIIAENGFKTIVSCGIAKDKIEERWKSFIDLLQNGGVPPVKSRRDDAVQKPVGLEDWAHHDLDVNEAFIIPSSEFEQIKPWQKNK